LIGGAAVLLTANGIIRTAKQLPEVSRTAVWGRAALCLGGFPAIGWVAISIIPGCRIHKSPLPGPDVQDAWPPVK